MKVYENLLWPPISEPNAPKMLGWKFREIAREFVTSFFLYFFVMFLGLGLLLGIGIAHLTELSYWFSRIFFLSIMWAIVAVVDVYWASKKTKKAKA